MEAKGLIDIKKEQELYQKKCSQCNQQLTSSQDGLKCVNIVSKSCKLCKTKYKRMECGEDFQCRPRFKKCGLCGEISKDKKQCNVDYYCQAKVIKCDYEHDLNMTEHDLARFKRYFKNNCAQKKYVKLIGNVVFHVQNVKKLFV